jgi:glyoxylase-like metal-dependent hydrolase (beta-lactamase superfamily II)
MVDPGHSQFYSHVDMGLAADGVKNPPQLALVSHCHPDHLEAALDLQRQGAKLAMHEIEAEYLDGEGRTMAAAFGLSLPDITVDVFLQEGELVLGDETLQVIHTPGHSPGHVCLSLPRLKALFAGDLIFAQGVGRVDFPGGSAEDLKRSIERVSQLELEYVLTGHGPILKGAQAIERNFQIIKETYFRML